MGFNGRIFSAVQGHRRSMILVPVESACATSCLDLRSVMHNLLLSCTVPEIWQLRGADPGIQLGGRYGERRYGERFARAYNGSLRAESRGGSSGRDPDEGVTGP